MADISVRKLRFEFDAALDFDVPDDVFGLHMSVLGLSLTMPYLEPYLIRTMKAASKHIEDPVLVEDARRFSQQEGHHYRNHAVFNEHLRSHFGEEAARDLRATESAMEADYQRFSRERSLRFNTAYAEGFEAMTCALALSSAVLNEFDHLPGGEIWAWHMAEEIEHRTVAFGVYEHLFGSYPYRIVVGTWSQWHYLSYVGRFSRRMAAALGRKLGAPRRELRSEFLRRYRRTWSPRYDPAAIEVPAGVDLLLARYSALAGH